LEVNVMAASAERIRSDIEAIAGFNSSGPGTNRLTFTPEYWSAVDYVADQLAALGYEKKVTSHGNTRFRRHGVAWSQPAVAAGSHLDAVVNGGRFDGVAGVVAAVEVARLLEETHVQLCRPYEVIVFAEEEGARFRGGLTGSKAMVGLRTREQLAEERDANGISYLEALGAMGASPSAEGSGVLRVGDIAAYFELHIEQSLVLDSRNIQVGIVQAITGLKQFWVTFSGVANHAGATPMSLRNDSLVAAARVICVVEETAAMSPTKTTVGTVGMIANEPNVANAIPGSTVFSIDIRDTDKDGLERATNTVLTSIQDIASGRGIRCEVRAGVESPSVALSARLRSHLVESATELGIEYLEMPSGAGHDAQVIAGIADAAMVFVPSIGGRSHCPEEDTSYTSIAEGANVLLGAVVKAAS
jgi:allantoate deiminase